MQQMSCLFIVHMVSCVFFAKIVCPYFRQHKKFDFDRTNYFPLPPFHLIEPFGHTILINTTPGTIPPLLRDL